MLRVKCCVCEKESVISFFLPDGWSKEHDKNYCSECWPKYKVVKDIIE